MDRNELVRLKTVLNSHTESHLSNWKMPKGQSTVKGHDDQLWRRLHKTSSRLLLAYLARQQPSSATFNLSSAWAFGNMAGPAPWLWNMSGVKVLEQPRGVLWEAHPGLSMVMVECNHVAGLAGPAAYSSPPPSHLGPSKQPLKLFQSLID